MSGISAKYPKRGHATFLPQSSNSLLTHHRANWQYIVLVTDSAFNLSTHKISHSTSAWRDLPGHRHGKLFIGRPCKKRSDDLLKLSKHQHKMVVAILTGHALVRGHLRTMGLFEGDPTCRFCRKETETVQHTICCCEALARQRYHVFRNPHVEPKDISTASVRDLCLFIRDPGLLNLCWMECLGLHNKPKTEVHTGQNADGP
jgi:hypothetical protein